MKLESVIQERLRGIFDANSAHGRFATHWRAKASDLDLVVTSQSLDWPLTKAGRQHVLNQIDHLELPVTHETLAQGSPHILQLRKTDKLFTRACQAREQMTTDLAWLTRWGTPDAPAKKKQAQRVRK